MLLHPNAKINLGLNIVRRRTDGYHDIETIFYPIPLTDALTIEPAATPMFRQTGGTLDCNPADNLVVRAMRRYAEHAGAEDATFSVILEKSIPAGAGLGGGSSDAVGLGAGDGSKGFFGVVLATSGKERERKAGKEEQTQTRGMGHVVQVFNFIN